MSTEAPQTEPEDVGDSLPPVRPFPWRQLVLGLVILLCGIAIGAGGGLLLGRKALVHTIRGRDPNPRELTGRMGQRLNLTAEQRKQVEAIVAERMGAVRKIREDSRPRISEQMQLMQKEVAEVLSDEQKAEWRKWFREVQRARPGSPPGWRQRRPDGRQPGPDGLRGPRPGGPGTGVGPGGPRNGRDRPGGTTGPTDAGMAPAARPSPPVTRGEGSSAAAAGPPPTEAPREKMRDSR